MIQLHLLHLKIITFTLRQPPCAKMGSQVVATILRSDISDRLDPAHATITEFKYLASYSWLESDVPTIVVPGKLFKGETCQMFRFNDHERIATSLVTAGGATKIGTRLRTSVR